MALYTLCFLNGQENNPVQLGPYLCNIKCFSFGRGKDTRIGTAFPEALPLTEAQAAIKIQAVIRGSRTRILNPIVRRQAPPPPLGAAWGPLPGVVTTSIVHVEVRSSAVTSVKSCIRSSTSSVPGVAAPVGTKPTGAWAQPRKW